MYFLPFVAGHDRDKCNTKHIRKCLLIKNAQDVLIHFVKRSANRVSHYLARYNCSSADRIRRIGDIHPDFHYVLLKDLVNY